MKPTLSIMRCCATVKTLIKRKLTLQFTLRTFVLTLNASSKQGFSTYYSCQNSVNRLPILFQRDKEKSFQPNLGRINCCLPTAQLFDLAPRSSVHFRKIHNKEMKNSDMGRKHKQSPVFSSLGDEQGRISGRFNVKNMLTGGSLKPLEGNLASTLQRLRRKPNP